EALPLLLLRQARDVDLGATDRVGPIAVGNMDNLHGVSRVQKRISAATCLARSLLDQPALPLNDAEHPTARATSADSGSPEHNIALSRRSSASRSIYPRASDTARSRCDALHGASPAPGQSRFPAREKYRPAT